MYKINQFIGFLVILKESFIVLSKNFKPIIFLTTISLLSSSFFFWTFSFSSANCLMLDMLAKESFVPISTSNNYKFSSHLTKLRDNFPLLVTTYVAFVFSYNIITFLLPVTTIILSAKSYNDTKGSTSLKELCLRIAKCWIRSFVTGLYTTIFVIGYFFFVLFFVAPIFSETVSSLTDLGTYVLFGIVAYVFYLNLSSTLILGLVVSVLEDGKISGFEALGKSAEIMKGGKFTGFLLNIFFNVLSLGFYLIPKMIRGKKYWISEDTTTGFFVVNGSCLVRILTFVAYTALYYKSEEKHDHEIELKWSNDVEYGKLTSTMPLVDS